jgi:hypothetical protein
MAAKTSRAVVRLLIFALSAVDRRAPLRLHFYMAGLAINTIGPSTAIATIND